MFCHLAALSRDCSCENRFRLVEKTVSEFQIILIWKLEICLRYRSFRFRASDGRTDTLVSTIHDANADLIRKPFEASSAISQSPLPGRNQTTANH